MIRFLTCLVCIAFIAALPAAIAQTADQPSDVLIRLDDAGMARSVNWAIRDVAEAGIPISVSIMPATPWFEEAAEVLRDHPEVAVGVHLTLNSEWKGYRWGPVLGKEAVPSLVDEVGYFRAGVADFINSGYDLAEVERELSAQVQRALDAGLDVVYLDYHMNTAVQTPELRALVGRLADQFGVALSGMLDENFRDLWATPIEEKQSTLIQHLGELEPGATTVVVFHVAHAGADMQLLDMNSSLQNNDEGEPLVHLHRQAELDALLSPEFGRWMEQGTVRLVTYRDLVTASR